MRRKTFDVLVSGGGMVVAVVLIVAGALAFWGYSFTNSNVHSQLAEQQIVFPSKAAFAQAKPGTEITPGMIPYLYQYAGEQLTTGPQAEAYADHFIAIHLQEIGGGKTYAQLSAAARALPAGSPAAAKAEAVVQTVFQGTTLRGLLLEAYSFSVFGEIAFWGAIVSWALGAVMLLLVGLGIWHARRTDESAELVGVHTVQAESKAA
jgi:hypothetical protein